MTDLPLILVLVNTPALRDAIAEKAVGFDLRWSLDLEANAVAEVTALLPALIVVELDRPADWLYRVRSDPATRRIPVIAVAGDAGARKRAKVAHADVVFSARELIEALPDALTNNARIFDKVA